MFLYCSYNFVTTFLPTGATFGKIVANTMFAGSTSGLTCLLLNRISFKGQPAGKFSILVTINGILSGSMVDFPLSVSLLQLSKPQRVTPYLKSALYLVAIFSALVDTIKLYEHNIF